MTKLTERERESFEKILTADLLAINRKFMNQIKDFWNIARGRVLCAKGWDSLMQEKDNLENERVRITQRIHEIEHALNAEDLRAEQAVELGGTPDAYGHVRGAAFYGIPVTSQFEYEIVEYIRNNMDLEIPSKVLHDIGQASIRALAMSGTFEEARDAYEKFYDMDFRKYGVDIPPRLDEICSDRKLLKYAHESVKQIEPVKQVESENKLPELPGQNGSA
jgi:hypothetical protein